MFVGASQLFPCDEPTCPGGEIEPPVLPFTSAKAESTVTTSGSGSLIKMDCTQWRSSGLNCCEERGDFFCAADCGAWKLIEVSAKSTTDVDYLPAAPTLAGSSKGKFYRPSDDVLLVQNIDFIANKYLFTGTGGGSYTAENEYDTTETIDTQCGCLGCNPVVVVFQNIGPGAPVPYSLAPTFYLTYVGVARYNVVGVTMTPTASGVAQGLWTIKTEGGQISLKSESGLTFSYGGTLTSARNQIQADGYFTATVNTQVVVVGGVTNAKTSDLPEFVVQTYSSTVCLPIVLAGTELAPSSTDSGITAQDGGAAYVSLFQRGVGYPDNRSGFDLFLNNEFDNPTLSSVELGYGSHFYPGPFPFYLPMHFQNTGGGTSTVTSSLDCEFSGQITVETGIVTCLQVIDATSDGNGGLQCPPGSNLYGSCCLPVCTPLSGCSTAAGYEGCIICENSQPVCTPNLSANCDYEECCTQICTTQTPNIKPVSIPFTQSVVGKFFFKTT